MLVRSHPCSFQVLFRHRDTIQRETNNEKVPCFLIYINLWVTSALRLRRLLLVVVVVVIIVVVVVVVV